jgi:hypothetical protein
MKWYALVEEGVMSKRSITSIGVKVFFSLILSYFCFFVPALRPCHGRLMPTVHET